jgi:hypothetical protein
MADLTCPSCGEAVPSQKEETAPTKIELAHSRDSSALTIEGAGCELRLVVRMGSDQERADLGFQLLELARSNWRKGGRRG